MPIWTCPNPDCRFDNELQPNQACPVCGELTKMFNFSEAVIIGVLGAVFGIALGWDLAITAAQVFTGGGFAAATGQGAAATAFSITPVLTPTVLLGAFGFGIAVSVIFAIYPAWLASKLKPVDALRYE